MSETIIIKALEQLKEFMNKDGIIEIVTRNQDKKFKEFYKIILEDSPSDELKKQLSKVANALKENNQRLSESCLKLDKLSSVTKLGASLSGFSLIMSGLNLCATCAGFIIMNKKLNDISAQIKAVLNRIEEKLDIQIDFEYNKILSEYTNMLDSRKKQRLYTEDQMRELVDGEYNVLDLLIKAFQIKEIDKDSDNENLLFSIFSLAAMLAKSIQYFDEIYYFNNKENIKNGEIWHSSHDRWVSIFDKLTSTEFVEKIQDHGLLTKGLSTVENDLYYKSLYDHVMDAKQEIADNQYLIQEIGTAETLYIFTDYCNQKMRETILNAFEKENVSINDQEIENFTNDAFRKLAIA